MKKAVILCAIACALYGATLLAIGIYLAQFNLAELFVQWLADNTGILALIFGIILYLPILLMQLIPFGFIFYGMGYLLCLARILYKLHEGDLPWLHKWLRVFSFVHGFLYTLVFIADLIIFPYIFKNINNGVSVALIVFTVLINVTSLAFEASAIVAVQKLKKYLYA